MTKFICTMCGEELELLGNDIIRPLHDRYHNVVLESKLFISTKLCGPMEKVYGNTKQGPNT